MASASARTTHKEMVRIGCFSAFWGDSSSGAFQLVGQGGHLDYLVGDYLSEVTMGILARLKSENKTGGYVSEFVFSVWKPLMKDIIAKGIKVIVNAGGMNPVECKNQIEKLAVESGLSCPSVAAVLGDDIFPRLSALEKEGKVTSFEIEGEKESLPRNRKIISANAYLGVQPIVLALQRGAQIVVTGRCTDSALVLAPLLYEFGWNCTDYDLLAQGSVAGHIIECGCQATGGNFTDWEQSQQYGWHNVGFPIVECFPDGSFIITKPENTGGIVNCATVVEQMLYEIADPSSYILPDVIVDFRYVKLTQLHELIRGTGRVMVTGARGRAPTPNYKVSVTYFDGFKLSASLFIGGFDATRKAYAVAHAILTKTRNIFSVKKVHDYEQVQVEVLGSEHIYGPYSQANHSREVILRITARHMDPKALEILAKEMAPSATAMAPGISGSSEGRPRPIPLMGYCSMLVMKSALSLQVKIDGSLETVQVSDNAQQLTPASATVMESVKYLSSGTALSGIEVYVPLITIAHARSGDKGDMANIGVIARKPEYYAALDKLLTSDAVHAYLSHLTKGKVSRYSLPGTNSFNFVCTRSLGGGGLSSLAIDRQGKTYAQVLLGMPLKVPIEWALPSSKL